MSDFEIVVATGPAASADMLAHDLEVIRPALLYADRVRLLSPMALFAMGTAAEFEVQDPVHKAQMLSEMGKATGADLPPELPAILSGLQMLVELGATGNRQQRRALERQFGRGRMRELRGLVKQLDDAWEEMRRAVRAQLVDGQPTEQMFEAANRGALELDPILDGAEFDLDKLMDGWWERIRTSVADPSKFVLFDDAVSDLLRSFLKEQGADLHDLARANSRQLGLASNFLARLPTLAEATVTEILDFRDEVDDAVGKYRSEMASMAAEVEADLHEEDFGAWAQQRWVNEIEPALTHIEAEARRNGLLRDVVTTGAARGRELGELVLAGLAAATVIDLSYSALASAAGGAAVVGADIVKLRQERAAEVRGSKFVLLHHVKTQL